MCNLEGMRIRSAFLAISAFCFATMLLNSTAAAAAGSVVLKSSGGSLLLKVDGDGCILTLFLI